MNKVKSRKEQIALWDWISLMYDDYAHILYHFLLAYIKSSIVFGANHEVTLDVISALQEYKENLSKEKKAYHYIRKNIGVLDTQLVHSFLENLDTYDQKAVSYFIKVFEDVEDATEIEDANRAKRRKRNFSTFVEDDSIANILAIASFTDKKIADDLQISREELSILFDKTYFLDHNEQENHAFYGIYLKLSADNRLENIKAFMPSIIDEESLTIYMQLLKSASLLRKKIGTILEKEEIVEVYPKEIIESIKETSLKKEKALIFK